MINYSTFGKLVDKKRTVADRSEGKAERERTQFVTMVRRQATGGAEKPGRTWFTKNDDGSFNVSLRKGTINLDLGGKKHLEIADWDNVVRFYEAVASAAESGAYDAQLASIAIVRKKKEVVQ